MEDGYVTNNSDNLIFIKCFELLITFYNKVKTGLFFFIFSFVIFSNNILLMYCHSLTLSISEERWLNINYHCFEDTRFYLPVLHLAKVKRKSY